MSKLLKVTTLLLLTLAIVMPLKTSHVLAGTTTSLPPLGFIDVWNCSTIDGWAGDPDTPAGPIGVVFTEIKPDGTKVQIGTDTTDVFRGDVNARPYVPPFIGNHGYSFPVPASFNDGLNHQVIAEAVGVDTTGAPDGVKVLLSGVAQIGPCPTPVAPPTTCPAGTINVALLGSGLTTCVPTTTPPATPPAVTPPPAASPPPSGSAVVTNGTNIPHTNLTDASIKTILQIVFGIAGSIAFLIIVTAGFRFITSQGDPGKTNNARNTIIYAIVGLVVSSIAFSIITFVLGNT